tara:strand:- start:738 stop:1097 length:360 start_codon:yes stop_codon:yes gene_type:complete
MYLLQKKKMEDYTIDDIIEIECGVDGYLHVKFRVLGDNKNEYREVETDEYVIWVEENFIDNDFSYDSPISDDEEEIFTDIVFNFDKWREYGHHEETVTRFIEDIYRTKDELPNIINDKN